MARVKYETVTRKECQDVADAACVNVQERNCQISQRPLHQDFEEQCSSGSDGPIPLPQQQQDYSMVPPSSSSFIIRKNPRSILKKVHRLI